MDQNMVGWFEIPVKDFDRAKAFYENILQVEIVKQEMDNLLMGWFPFNETAPGATGTLVKAESYEPSYAGTLVYFNTTDIEGVLQRVAESGGKVINEKMAIGEYGFVGHFEDSEGNRLGLHSRT